MQKRTVVVALCAVFASAAAITAVAQRNVLMKGLDPNKSASLVVNGSETPLGVVDGSGDLDAALDTNKNYTVFKRDCSKYEIVPQEQVSDYENRCRRDEPNAPAPGESCGRCVPVGLIVKGKFQLTQTSGIATGGSNKMRNISIGAAAAAVGIGAYAATRDDNGTDAAFALSNVPVNVNATAGARSCNIFQTTYTSTGVWNVPSNGTGTFRETEPSGFAREYQVTLRHQGDSATVSGSLNWTSPSGRNFSSTVEGTVNRSGGGTLVVTHRYLSGGSAGPAPNCSDAHNLSVTP